MKKKDFSILRDIDKFLASFGIIFSLILIIYLWRTIGTMVYVIVGFFILVICVVWLIIRDKISLRNTEFYPQPFLCKILFISFFILLTFSIFFIYTRSSLYERPLTYFISISLMVGIVTLEILFIPTKNKYISLILFQIITIALNLIWSQSLIFPSLVGVDPFWHQAFTQRILDTGRIPTNSGYSYFPIMHLEIGITSLVTDLNYKLSTMFSIAFIQVVGDVILIFLIGRILFNEKVGLLAGLLLGIANQYLSMGFSAIPTTIAAVYMLIIIYLLFKNWGKKILVGITLSFLFMVTLVLTHPLTAVCMSIILFVGWITFFIHNKIYHKYEKIPIPLIIVIFFFLIMFSWWIYVSNTIKILADFIKLGFSIDFFSGASGKIIINSYLASVPLIERLFNQLGIFFFFSCALIGCFYMLSRKYGNRSTSSFAIIGLTTLAIGFFPLITGFSVIENRWWYYSQIFLAIPLAVSFLLLSKIPKRKYIISAVLVGLTIFLSFIMIMSPSANTDNPFSLNTNIRAGFFTSELQSIDTISRLSNKTIATDEMFSSDMNSSGYISQNFDEGIYNKNFSGYHEKLLLIRTEILNKPFKLFLGPYRIDYNLEQELIKEKYSRLYDSGSVGIYGI